MKKTITLDLHTIWGSPNGIEIQGMYCGKVLFSFVGVRWDVEALKAKAILCALGRGFTHWKDIKFKTVHKIKLHPA